MNPDKTETSIFIDAETTEMLLSQIAHKELVRKKLKEFWDTNGEIIVNQYKDLLLPPEHINISKDAFDEKIKACKVLIISANSVEGAIVSHRLIKENNYNKLEAYAIDGQLYQFATIGTIPVLHIWPTNISSFTKYGSFRAIDAALDRVSPKYVVSVGVAFGIAPEKQSLGDVLISKQLVFYDNYNKVADGKIKLFPQETYILDAFLQAQLHQLERKTPPKEIESFNNELYFGAMLSGGTVLSDANEKRKLCTAASNLGYSIVGGEMEASGIYYACQGIKNRHIPFIVIKGICDWGSEKNGWETVVNGNCDNEIAKDCVQAFACDNAFAVMAYCISRLNME